MFSDRNSVATFSRSSEQNPVQIKETSGFRIACPPKPHGDQGHGFALDFGWALVHKPVISGRHETAHPHQMGAPGRPGHAAIGAADQDDV